MKCSGYTEICGHDARTRVMEFFLDFILVEIKDGEQQRHKLKVVLQFQKIDGFMQVKLVNRVKGFILQKKMAEPIIKDKDIQVGLI